VRLLVGLLAAAALWPAAAHASVRCYGAAARDPAHPCVNAKLRYRVDPRPGLAAHEHGAPCARQPVDGFAAPCAFGVPQPAALREFALIGDSHAAHWRTALAGVARAERWRGFALTRNSCPFSAAPRSFAQPAAVDCARFSHDVADWLTRHPAVDTVFVAEETSPSEPFADAVQGFMAAWQTLPASVQRVVILRDTPTARPDVLRCVSRATRRHRAPGTACAQPIAAALPPDPAVAAAAQEGSPRFQTIDLTRFFCDAADCFPVVGGVLVYLDQNHLTPLFAGTLAPYLRRAIDHLK
jgi:hypothetical protein